MELNGVSLSSLVTAKQMTVYTHPAAQKVEKASQRQSSAHQSPNQDGAFFQGKDSSPNSKDEPLVEKENGAEFKGLEPNTYTLKHDQPGVEQVVLTGKTIKREA